MIQRGTLNAYGILAGLALLAGLGRAVFTIGAVLVGFYGFLPAILATDQWDLLDAGAWLGLCGGALITVGALIMLMPGRTETRAMSTDARTQTAAGLAAVGLVLGFVALWVDAEDGTGSYWNFSGGGHSLGVVMLIALIACAAGLAGAVLAGMAPAAGLAALGGLIACGLFLAIPVGNAFGDLGRMRAGAWLGFFGGLLIAIGVVKLSSAVMAGASAPAMTAPTPPPPATA